MLKLKHDNFYLVSILLSINYFLFLINQNYAKGCCLSNIQVNHTISEFLLFDAYFFKTGIISDNGGFCNGYILKNEESYCILN